METPTTQDIIDKVILTKIFIKSQDLQMGIGYNKEKFIINNLNAILRMLKCPVRKVNFRWDKTEPTKESNR